MVVSNTDNLGYSYKINNIDNINNNNNINHRSLQPTGMSCVAKLICCALRANAHDSYL